MSPDKSKPCFPHGSWHVVFLLFCFLQFFVSVHFWGSGAATKARVFFLLPHRVGRPIIPRNTGLVFDFAASDSRPRERERRCFRRTQSCPSLEAVEGGMPGVFCMSFSSSFSPVLGKGRLIFCVFWGKRGAPVSWVQEPARKKSTGFFVWVLLIPFRTLNPPERVLEERSAQRAARRPFHG